ncbi:MAG: cytidylate kinase-like family protein [Chloroflexi bacterium]|nr:cytidylate kinase-like family protein [Chloroflexota bacterium]
MPIVTLNGQIGTGVSIIGTEVARLLGADFVDQMLLVEAAHRIGAPVHDVADKDQRVSRTGERLSRFLQNFLEKSAVAGSAGDPFLGPAGVEVILSRPYPEAARPAASQSQELDDKRLATVMSALVHEEAKTGNTVIVGRAGNIILADVPTAFHINLVASHEYRVKSMMERDRVDRAAAEKSVREVESARLNYVKKFYKVEANDPAYFHLVLNVTHLRHQTAAHIISEGVRAFEAALAAPRS